MKDIIIISPSNKNAIKAIGRLTEAKTAFKEFIANGGKPKDFKKKVYHSCLTHRPTTSH